MATTTTDPSPPLSTTASLVARGVPAGVQAPWADQPVDLVHTPAFATNKTDLFTTGATHMCLLHNAILRGYNTIYHQAPLVASPQDKADFVGYCLTWFKFVKAHHDDEEDNLFPAIAKILDDPDVWKDTHQEHESFLADLAAFHDYLAGLANPATDFDGLHLRKLMAAFETNFAHHFHNEIPTIAALADHPNAPAPGSPVAVEAAATFKAWGKATLTKAGTLDVVPFALLNLDRRPGSGGDPDKEDTNSFENGRWANWPPMPAPIRWGLVNLAGAWHGSWWRFASCDSQGLPQTLWAVREENQAPKEEAKTTETVETAKTESAESGAAKPDSKDEL